MKRPCGFCGISTIRMKRDELEEHLEQHKAAGDDYTALFAALGAFVSTPSEEPEDIAEDIDQVIKAACPPRSRLRLVPDE
jgi:hypothetical protein